MSFNLDNLASISLASPRVLAWSIFPKVFGFASGLFVWLCVATLFTGFVVAKTQRQKSFKELCDAAGHMIPDGPRPLPILGKGYPDYHKNRHMKSQKAKKTTRILSVSDTVP